MKCISYVITFSIRQFGLSNIFFLLLSLWVPFKTQGNPSHQRHHRLMRVGWSFVDQACTQHCYWLWTVVWYSQYQRDSAFHNHLTKVSPSLGWNLFHGPSPLGSSFLEHGPYDFSLWPSWFCSEGTNPCKHMA